MSSYTANGFIGKLLGFLIILIIVIVLGVAAALIFIVPIDKIHIANFDAKSIAIGNSTVGDILDGESITISQLFGIVNNAFRYDESALKNKPTESDLTSANAKIAELLNMDDLSKEELEEIIKEILEGNQEFNIKKSLTLTDKEMLSLIKNEMNKLDISIPADYEQLVFNTASMECVMSVDLSSAISQLPDIVKNFIKQSRIYITVEYSLKIDESKVSILATYAKIGNASLQDSKIILNFISALVDFDSSVLNLPATPVLEFLNNLGVVGFEESQSDVSAINNGAVTVQVNLQYP